MNRTILQVPVDQDLRVNAEKVASAQGFSSLQEAVRVFLNKLAQGTIQITFEESVRLSEKAINRYNKILEDIEKKENIYEAESVDDLVGKLHNAS